MRASEWLISFHPPTWIHPLHTTSLSLPHPPHLPSCQMPYHPLSFHLNYTTFFFYMDSLSVSLSLTLSLYISFSLTLSLLLSFSDSPSNFDTLHLSSSILILSFFILLFPSTSSAPPSSSLTDYESNFSYAVLWTYSQWMSYTRYTLQPHPSPYLPHPTVSDKHPPGRLEWLNLQADRGLWK